MMSETVEEVLERIAAEPRVWVRFVAVRNGDGNSRRGECPCKSHHYGEHATLCGEYAQPGNRHRTRRDIHLGRPEQFHIFIRRSIHSIGD